jgi:hypothetical protein|tara:strand:+ start:308 stop:517 length:210 start_codon:yes stop_codon:yes gene_type:complete
MDEEINKHLLTAGKSTDVRHLRRELSHDIRMKFEDRQEEIIRKYSKAKANVSNLNTPAFIQHNNELAKY